MDGLKVGAAVWVVSALLMFVAGRLILPAIGGMAGQLIGAMFAARGFLAALLFMLLSNLGGLVMGGGMARALLGPGLLLFLIPIFGAIAGGYVITTKGRSSGAGAGAAVAAGFVVLHVLAIIVILLMFGGGGTGGGAGGGGSTTGLVRLVVYFVVGGVVQPAIFGAVGGSLGS